MRTSKSTTTLGSPSFMSPRGKYCTHSERSPTYASHSLHGGTPGNWQGGRCIACTQGLEHSSREAAVRAKKLQELEAELEAERGAKVKAELATARSDAELRRSERERSLRGERERARAAKRVQLSSEGMQHYASENVPLSSFPSESAAQREERAALRSAGVSERAARREQAEKEEEEEEEEEELQGTRAAHERKGVQLSEGKLSDQLEAALASALLELKEARAELRLQRDRSEETKSAAEESQQESLRLQRRSSRAEAEAEELREQLRAAQAEQQALRLRCTAAEEELLAQGSAARIAGRTQQAHCYMRTAACALHAALHVHCMCTACRTACALHVHCMCTACALPHCTCACTLHVHPQVPPPLLTTTVTPHHSCWWAAPPPTASLTASTLRARGMHCTWHTHAHARRMHAARVFCRRRRRRPLA